MPTARILIVDDDAPLRLMMARALAAEGYAIACAADGAEALGRLTAGGAARVDLILLDWRMPVPGWVFAERYRTLPEPRAPVVVLTGASDVVDAAIHADARGFLRKPFDLDELLDLIARLLSTADAA